MRGKTAQALALRARIVLACAEPQAPTDGALAERLAARLGLSQTAVSRIWRAFALAPQRTESFKLSKDPQFVEKVRDIVGLYLNPPDRALVLCMDEKPSIQATFDTAPTIAMAPGQLERHTHDYVRHGTTDLCSQRSTSRPAPSSARSTGVTARASFAIFWPFTWHKTADQILASVARFCQRTADSHH